MALNQGTGAIYLRGQVTTCVYAYIKEKERKGDRSIQIMYDMEKAREKKLFASLL